MRKAVIALAVLLSVQVQAKTDPNQAIESDEEQQYYDLQAICGDNILCYFTEQEINLALGPMANSRGVEAAFKMDGGEADFSAEELFNGDLMAFADASGAITDFSARRRTSPRGGKTSKPGKGGGSMGYKGISPIGAPIWPSFVGKFKQCAKGCVPYIVSVHRPGAVSCHNGGRAIDVGGLVCGGKTHMAISRGRFDGFVSCMRGKMKTLYRNGPGLTAGHRDHAHFSNGCSVAGHPNYY